MDGHYMARRPPGGTSPSVYSTTSPYTPSSTVASNPFQFNRTPSYTSSSPAGQGQQTPQAEYFASSPHTPTSYGPRSPQVYSSVIQPVIYAAEPQPSSPGSYPSPVTSYGSQSPSSIQTPSFSSSQYSSATSPLSAESMASPNYSRDVGQDYSQCATPVRGPPPAQPAPQGPPAPPPPPPPPPPPMPSGGNSIPSWQGKQQTANRGRPPPPSQDMTSQDGMTSQYANLPAALHGTLNKDKKPFTYTPGGLDLSEIKSPRIQRRIQAHQEACSNMNEPQTNGVVSSPAPVQAHELRPVQNNSYSPSAEQQQQQQQLFQQLQQKQQHQQPRQKQQSQYMAPTSYNSPINAYSPENAAQAYQNQAAMTRQLDGLNLADGDPRSPTSGINYTGSLPRNHGTPRYEDQQSPSFPQSRSFRVLQMITDTADGEVENQAPKPRTPREEDEMRFTGLRRNQGIPSRAFSTLQKMTDTEDQYIPPRMSSQGSMGLNNLEQNSQNGENYPPEAVDPRYKGGHIPGRCFKLLQEMTGITDEEASSIPPSVFSQNRQQPPQQQPAKPRKKTEIQLQVGMPSMPTLPPQKQFPQPEIPASEQKPEEGLQIYKGASIPSRSFRFLQAMTGEIPADAPGLQGTDC